MKLKITHHLQSDQNGFTSGNPPKLSPSLFAQLIPYQGGIWMCVNINANGYRSWILNRSPLVIALKIVPLPIESSSWNLSCNCWNINAWYPLLLRIAESPRPITIFLFARLIRPTGARSLNRMSVITPVFFTGQLIRYFENRFPKFVIPWWKRRPSQGAGDTGECGGHRSIPSSSI